MGPGAISTLPANRPAGQARGLRLARKKTPVYRDEAYTRTPANRLNSAFLDGMTIEGGPADVMIARLRRLGQGPDQPGGLRDLGRFSRSALLGPPIAVHPLRSIAGPVPVPKDQLPVLLPKISILKHAGNPLERHASWQTRSGLPPNRCRQRGANR